CAPRAEAGREPRVTVLPVGGRIEVWAAAEDEAVDAVEERRGVVDIAVGGEEHAEAAGPLEPLGVREPQCEPRRRDVALAAPARRGPGRRGLGPQLVRDDPDQRRGGAARGGGGGGGPPPR